MHSYANSDLTTNPQIVGSNKKRAANSRADFFRCNYFANTLCVIINDLLRRMKECQEKREKELSAQMKARDAEIGIKDREKMSANRLNGFLNRLFFIYLIFYECLKLLNPNWYI